MVKLPPKPLRCAASYGNYISENCKLIIHGLLKSPGWRTDRAHLGRSLHP